MLLLVGLGNPGKQYLNNRHNVGFMVLDELAESYGFAAYKNKFSGEISSGIIVSQKILIFKPGSFMNNSGFGVRDVANFYQIPLDNIIVIHDDLDLPLAKVKLKKAGGSAGHNGIKSIDMQLGKDYWRLRIGIGRPEYKEQVSSYVLSNFQVEEKAAINDIIKLINKNIAELFDNNRTLFMDKIYGI